MELARLGSMEVSLVRWWSWISTLAEPYFLAALGVALGLSHLLLPGGVGWMLGIALAVGLFWLDHRLTRSVSRLPAKVGMESMEGEIATVVEPLAPRGVVATHGERWKAVELLGRRVGRGEKVRVIRAVGLVLEVESLNLRWSSLGLSEGRKEE